MINCLAYTAGPYRAKCEFEVVQNILRAEQWALELWRRKIPVICPHKNTALMGGAHGLPDDVWLKGDLIMIRRCDVVVMIPGWEQSSGSVAEKALAEKNLIQVATPTCFDDLDDLAALLAARHGVRP